MVSAWRSGPARLDLELACRLLGRCPLPLGVPPVLLHLLCTLLRGNLVLEPLTFELCLGPLVLHLGPPLSYARLLGACACVEFHVSGGLLKIPLALQASTPSRRA